MWTAEQKWVAVFQERYGRYLTYDYGRDLGVPGLPLQPPLPEPEWPGLSFQELLGITFKDRCIYSLDDPVVEHVLFQAYGDRRYGR